MARKAMKKVVPVSKPMKRSSQGATGRAGDRGHGYMKPGKNC